MSPALIGAVADIARVVADDWSLSRAAAVWYVSASADRLRTTEARVLPVCTTLYPLTACCWYIRCSPCTIIAILESIQYLYSRTRLFVVVWGWGTHRYLYHKGSIESECSQATASVACRFMNEVRGTKRKFAEAMTKNLFNRLRGCSVGYALIQSVGMYI